MDNFLSDIRYALRGLMKAPGVALIAVVALGLGIGLTTVMFSIVYGALHRGLPFENADRIMGINRSNPSQDEFRIGVTQADYLDWKERQRSFDDLGAYYVGTVNVTSGESPVRYMGGFMTGNSLAILGVQPMLGRGFTPDDSRPGAPMTIILGERAWRDHFGSDSGVLGRTVKVNGEIGTVIGVMPESFRFPEAQEVWVPLRIDAVATPRGEGQGITVFGKTREGVSLDAANAEMAGIASALATEFPATNEGITTEVRPFTDNFMGDEERGTLYAMLATVALVLLIACANVANLLLARAAVRTRDVAIRVSIGATRARVVVQMLAESLVLSLAGSLLGMVLAWVGIGMFDRAVAPTNPPFWFVFKLDAPILAFVAGISVLAALASGIIPALRASSTDVNSILKDESRGSSSLHMGRLTRGLVVAEVAMSVALLVASGMMIRSVVELNSMELPYATEDVFSARIALFPEQMPDPATRAAFWEQVEERVAALPGVRGAGLTSQLPGLGSDGGGVQIEGASYTADRDIPSARFALVSPGFFATFGIEPVQGRLFTPQDTRDATPVAVVNQSFVRERFPDGVALGRRIRGGGLQTEQPWLEIVGVVPDAGLTQMDDNADRESPAGFYRPLAQGDAQFISVAARTDREPLSLSGPVRDAVVAVNADTPIYFVDTVQGRIDDELWFYSIFGALFAVFGGAALFMASVGLYGVMSFSVSRRVQEMGIRMALGAEGSQVRALILRQGMTQIAIGLVLGTGLAVLVAKGLAIFLLNQQTFDPATYALVFVILGLTGLAASAVPAARATRVDPIEALRSE